MNNCKAVVKLGVTTVFTGSSGVTKQIWQKALQKFPAPGSILKLYRAQWYPFLTQHPNLTTAEHGVIIICVGNNHCIKKGARVEERGLTK